METIQIDHISRNLPELIRFTNCHAEFLANLVAEDVLILSDLEVLDNEPLPLKKSERLYKILISRKHSYTALLHALEKTNQTGALEILEGLVSSPSLGGNKYVCPPEELQTFINSDKQQVLVICTLDSDVTCDKIKGNVLNSQIYSVLEYLNSSFGRRRLAKLPVINCGKDIETLLKSPLKIFGKLVLVTHDPVEIVKTIMRRSGVDPVYQSASVVFDKTLWSHLHHSFQQQIRFDLEQFFGSEIDFDPVFHTLEESTLLDLIHEEYSNIFKDKNSYPQMNSNCLIPRAFEGRNVINSKIFKTREGDNDIFVFESIQRHDLSKFAEGQDTDTSGSQVLRESLSVRFIISESSKDFDRICAKTESPVHLLKFVENLGVFVWQRSRGTMKSLQRAVHTSQFHWDDSDFLDKFNGSKGAVCIFASPGMGKSVTLVEIGRKLSENQDTTVCFMLMIEFVKEIKRLSAAKSDENLGQCIINTVISHCCHNKLAEVVFRSKLCANTLKLELLLDGVDEVDEEYLDFGMKILTELHTFQYRDSVRVWLTSRNHLAIVLEETLEVLGCRMEPFEEQDQLQFLQSYWSQTGELDEAKLVAFCNECLRLIKDNLNSRDRNIAEVPLQCLLIAEVFEEQAKDYADLDNVAYHAPPKVHLHSLTELYKMMVLKKISKLRSCGGSVDQNGFSEDALLDLHLWYSLQLLFPASDNFKEELVNNDIPESTYVSQALRLGMVESVSSSHPPRFLHRTFAEYFVALFVIRNLCGDNVNPKFSDFLCDHILETVKCDVRLSNIEFLGSEKSQTFKHDVILSFMNGLLKQEGKLINISPNVGLVLSVRFGTTPEKAVDIAQASLIADFDQVFKFFHDLGVFSNGVAGEAVAKMFDDQFLLGVVKQSSLEIVKLACDYFVQHTGKQVKSVHARFSETNPLNVALLRGNYSVVEYLLNNHGFGELVIGKDKSCQHLLHSVADMSMYVSGREEVDHRIQIIRLLLDLDRGLLEERDFHRTPLTCHRVHLEVILELIRQGANLFAKDVNGATVLQTVVGDWSAQDYHELITHIPTETLKPLVKSRERGGFTPVHSSLRSLNVKFETLDIFKKVGFDFEEERDDHGESVMFCAIRGHRPVKYFDKLVELGCNMEAKGEDGRSVMHAAVSELNKDAIQYFLERGIAVNVPDDEGLTPLNHVLNLGRFDDDPRPFEVASFLVRKSGRIFDPGNSAGQSLLHVAVQRGAVSGVKMLLGLGLGVGVDVNAKDHQGNTPLHQVVLRNRNSDVLKVAQLLFEHFADVDQVNRNGDTALMCMLKKGEGFGMVDSISEKVKFPLLELFIQNEALGSNKHLATRTLRWVLTQKKGPEEEDEYRRVAELCVEQGGDLEWSEKATGNNLLHEAVLSRCVFGVGYLISKGLEVNLRNKVGVTPLALLVMEETESIKYDVEIFEALDSGGAEVESAEVATNLLRFMVGNTTDLKDVESRFERVVKCCIEKGANLNYVNDKGDTLLHLAAHFRYPRGIGFLLEHGLDPKLQNLEGDTPLHKAAGENWSGNEDERVGSVKLLVIKGADLFDANNEGKTPLHLICKLEEIAGLLNEVEFAHFHTNRTQVERFLCIVVSHGPLSNIKFACEWYTRRFSFDDLHAVLGGNDKTKSLLHLAVERGFLVIVEFLVNECRFCDVLERLDDLVYTCVANTRNAREARGRDKILQYLVDKQPGILQKGQPLAFPNVQVTLLAKMIELGADTDSLELDTETLNATTPGGYGILNEIPQYVTPQAYHKIIQQLVEKGLSTILNKDFGVQRKQTAIQNAVFSLELQKATVKLLADNGADFNVADESGRSAFFYAVAGGRSGRFLKWLVDIGNADWRIVDTHGSNLLHLTAYNCNLSAMQYLIQETGCDVNLKDNDGDTPLHSLLLEGVRKGDKEIVASCIRCLVDRGRAHVKIENLRGQTAVGIATSLRKSQGLDESLVELLESCDL